MTQDQALFCPVSVAPMPEGAGFFRSLRTIARNTSEIWPESLYHAPYTVQRFFGRQFVHLADPEMIKDVLLTRSALFPKSDIEQSILERAIGLGLLSAKDAQWKVQRKASSPVFRHANLMKLAPSMIDAGRRVTDRLLARTGARCDVLPEMSMAALEVIANTLLSGDEDEIDFQRLTEDVDMMVDQVGRIDPLDFFPMLRDLPKPWALGGRRAVQRLRRQAAAIVQARRRGAHPREDLLSMLMAATDPDTGQGLTDIELRDNINTFIGAGYDTTSLTLTWTLYLLAHAPAWQEVLWNEVRQVCGDEPLTPEHLEQLSFHNMVVNEALRLFPPVPAMDRVALEDVTLGELSLKKGDILVIAIYAMHRNSLLWDDPHCFDPGRFSAERARDHHRFQFIPFSGGPRTCIGMKFSMMEATAILAQIIRHTRIEPHPDTAPYPRSRMTLRPEGGMPLIIRPR